MTKQTNKMVGTRNLNDCNKKLRMRFHIGEIIQREVKEQSLTHREFGLYPKK